MLIGGTACTVNWPPIQLSLPSSQRSCHAPAPDIAAFHTARPRAGDADIAIELFFVFANERRLSASTEADPAIKLRRFIVESNPEAKRAKQT
jgi:hypothetical protein